MRSYTHYLWFTTKSRRDLINITNDVETALRESGVQEGLCLVSAMHITAAIWVNDNEPGLWQDFSEWVERLAPQRPNYQHHRTGEDNGDAHLKRTLVHQQVVLPVTAGRLDLGPWEQVFYAEFDGQRRKRVVIKVIGE
ncbi:MAG: secondary thiamine-phosphate synthase enzyme YjbQ [Dehalococcoidia bacterium]|jgi:secondary thiamine-phosphate synthase enzyme